MEYSTKDDRLEAALDECRRLREEVDRLRAVLAHGGKREVRVYDYADVEVPMFARMYEKRMRGYRSYRNLGYVAEGTSSEDALL